ncbi:M48 family metalloprotease [Niveibacterium sp.]|uniref:M48 family metalloprotease n=1 Tax=Niveibacterium sp. TaxID=2017444 RepID=UPI0035B2E0D8
MRKSFRVVILRALLAIASGASVCLAHAEEQRLLWELTHERVQALTSNTVRFSRNNVVALEMPTTRIKMLDDVYQRLVAVTGLTRSHLVLVKDATANAYATKGPDGYAVVAVHSGIFDLVRDDPDMLAAVLGHEIGHNIKGHRGYVGTQRNVDALTQLLVIALGNSHASSGAKIAGAVAGNLALTAGLRSFDRDQEREADDYGVEHMIRAGFDPAGAERVWSNPMMRGGGLFATHPASSERLANVKRLSVDYAYLRPATSPETMIAKNAPPQRSEADPKQVFGMTDAAVTALNEQTPYWRALLLSKPDLFNDWLARQGDSFVQMFKSDNGGDAVVVVKMYRDDVGKKLQTEAVKQAKAGNQADALRRLNMATGLGYAPAAYTAGVMVEKGTLTNSGEAGEWYSRAADLGSLPAKEALHRLRGEAGQ